MKTPAVKSVRCAIYTRVSTEQGLDQDFNSLDAQYEAASAYIKSQTHAGWSLIRSRYDDGGYSGGSTDRPDLQRLLEDIRARKIDVIVVYKVDRLTRSLADFAKLVELFDSHGVSFVSITQQFNTTTSMGPKNERPEIPPETTYLASSRNRAVCGDWVVETVGLELVTHHPVIEPFSGQSRERNFRPQRQRRKCPLFAG
jgi:hypothetical protein